MYYLYYSANFLSSITKYALVCLLLIPALCYSQQNVLTVISGDNQIYQHFYSELESGLNESHTLTKVHSHNINDDTFEKYDLIISIGSRAAKTIANYEVQQTVIYTLIPDNESLLNTVTCKVSNCYSVYINQPAIRYVELFNALFTENHRLVLASTRANTKISKQLLVATKKNKTLFKEIHVDQHGNVARSLINQLNSNDILLALPDAAIYNATHSKNIILSAYHKNIPIIAYSKAFAKAGALISLYSSIEDIAEQTSSLVNTIHNNGKQEQKEYYPDEFSIEINSAVARSLNLSIDSKNAIMRKIK